MHLDEDLKPQSFWRRRVVAPIKAQLKQGITPDQIALTIAIGTVLSLFPVIGTTTVLCAITAFALRLNQPIIHVVNYIVYPLQIALFIPFLHAGKWLGAPAFSLSIDELMARFDASAWRFFADFGLILLGAAGVWCILALPATALLYFGLRPAIRHMAARRARGAVQ